MDNNDNLKTVKQPPKDANRKALLNKVLLIAWLAVCTAIFIYFVTAHIASISAASEDLSNWKSKITGDPEFAAAVIAGIESHIRAILLYLISLMFLYASFLALAVPKLIKAFRPSVIENRIDKPTL